MKRWTRRPRFPFYSTGYLNRAAVIHKQLVAPGETLKELLVSLETRTDPVDLKEPAAYAQYEFFYVPLRLLDEGFVDHLVEGSALTLGTYVDAADASPFFAEAGAREWERAARTLIWQTYYPWEIDGAQIPRYPNPEADWTTHYTSDSADQDITTATTTNELDEAYGQREWVTQKKSWDGSYRRYLQTMGVATPDEALDQPERICRARRFVRAEQITDPATGDLTYAFRVKMERSYKKPLYFAEHGILIGFATLMPKILVDTPDPLSYITSPEEWPNASMLTAHVFKDAAKYHGVAAERISLNEVLYQGRHLIAGEYDSEARNGQLYYRPQSRLEAKWPDQSSVYPTDTAGQTKALMQRCFGAAFPSQSLRYSGLVAAKFQTGVPRNGTDFRPSVYVEQ